jgi:ketopantoate hydroxymethyltransferase
MTKRITISSLDAMKASGDKFVMITAYDATFARLASEAWLATHWAWCSRAMRRQSLSRWKQ